MTDRTRTAPRAPFTSHIPYRGRPLNVRPAGTVSATAASPLSLRLGAADTAASAIAAGGNTAAVSLHLPASSSQAGPPRVVRALDLQVGAHEAAAIARAERVAIRRSAEAIRAFEEIDGRNDLCTSEKLQRYLETDRRLKTFIDGTPEPALAGVAGSAFSVTRERAHAGHGQLVERQRMTSAEDQMEEVVSVILATLQKIDDQAPPPGGRRQAYRDTFDRLTRLAQDVCQRDPLGGLECQHMILQARREAKIRYARLPAE
jgi:hypothetical protein